MNNEITVTRAPRGKKLSDIGTGKYAVHLGNGECMLKNTNSECFSLIDLPEAGAVFDYRPNDWVYGLFHEFESFDAMCKWVANGRKLEDLQSDGKDEWIPALNMALGTYAEVVKPFGDLVKWDVVFRRNDDNYPILKVSTGFGCAGRTLGEESKLMVWPLGPGDSITITPKNA